MRAVRIIIFRAAKIASGKLRPKAKCSLLHGNPHFLIHNFPVSNFFMINIAERITIIPGVCNGQPTIRGMRVTVKAIVDFIAAGETKESLLKSYSYLTDEDINAAVEYASKHVI
jgi:uncharacterized protein (DUF433 family)